MSEKPNKEVKATVATENKTFQHRNFKKTFTTFKGVEVITPDFHLELGENNEAVIVQDRNTDWEELANRDVDKVGLSNILELARKRGDDLSRFAYNDGEAVDTSDIDPLDPNATLKMVKQGDKALAELKALADKYNVSVNDLINASLNNTLDKIVKATEKVEGDDNA